MNTLFSGRAISMDETRVSIRFPIHAEAESQMVEYESLRSRNDESSDTIRTDTRNPLEPSLQSR